MKISSYSKQQGVASLLTAVVLLTCITLVVLFTSKTVVMDTKMTADNVRTAQATAAAQAAMDQAVAYMIAGGLDQYKNATTNPYAVTTTTGADTPTHVVDYTLAHPMNLTLTSGTQTTTARFYFDNSPGNRCDCAAGNCFASSPMDKALVVAIGWSDDGSATRTVSQCVGSFNILNVDPNTGGAGVPAPLVGVSSVGVNGNATLINRFTQSNVWAGDPNYTIAGQSMATYLRQSGTSVSDFTLDQLIAEIPSNGSLTGTVDGQPLSDYTQISSNSKSGNGVDIIVGDNTLAKVTFQTFFSQTLTQVITSAESEGHCYASGTTITPSGTTTSLPCTAGGSIPSTSTGTIVTDGTATLPSVLGSATNPIILVVNGNFSMTGNTTFYGFIYVTGQIHLGGQAKIIGSAISEDPNPPSGTGAGSPQVIYRPMGGNLVDRNGNPTTYDLTNFVRKGVISGSWRDW